MGNKVVARYAPINRISPADVLIMYGIFSRYYDNAPLETFLADMSKKTGAFILRDRERRIVGFSTVARMKLTIGRRTMIGVFSGDTIIEKEYWGSRALPLAFFLYLVRQIVMHPLTPVFWLLISKGYKTYLLLANNFFRFYPHPEGKYQQYQPLVPQYCEALFPGCYRAEKGILEFGESCQRLKGDVAPITDELRARFPRIAFFEQANPGWAHGNELPCVGRAGPSDAFRYLFRYLGKVFSRPSESRRNEIAAMQQPCAQQQVKPVSAAARPERRRTVADGAVAMPVVVERRRSASPASVMVTLEVDEATQ